MNSPVYPEHLTVGLCGTEIQVPRVVAKGGNYWWILLEESGSPAYRGVPMKPLDEALPKTVTIAGVEKTFEAVPKWDSASKKALEETKPFEKTRRVHPVLDVNGVHLQVQVRITVRKDGDWNFFFKAWQLRQGVEPTQADVSKIGGLFEVFG